MEGRKDKRVYELDLHGKKLVKIEGLEKFAALRILDLSCNELHQIEGLDKNRDLRELKLYGNKIVSLGGLENLSELCHLQLQHNQINQIGKGLCCLKKLRILRLDHNHLATISSNEIVPFGGHMTHLDLSCNRLTSVQGLGAVTNLEELKLVGNQLTDLPDLSRCKKLTELDVSSNPLQSGVLVKLKNKQLKILRVECLHLETVSTSLPKLSQLEELYAAGNDFSTTAGLPTLYPMLEVLDVRQNKLQSVDSFKPLAKLGSLSELQLESNLVCSQCENYRAAVRELLPQLELIDGVTSSVAMGTAGGSNRTVHIHTPLMRPLTPSSVGPSLHQIEHQLLETEIQLENYTSGLLANFELMRCHHYDDHPLAQPPPLSDSATCTHTCSSPQGVTLGRGESGIERGSNVGDSILREKALHNDGYSKDVSDDDHRMVACGVNEEERLSAAAAVSLREEGRPASGHGSRPSTRGSSRARIQEALAFASENFKVT